MPRPKHVPYGAKPKKKTEIEDGVDKKKHKWRAGTLALREIRKYQHRTDQLVPRAVVNRVVRDIASDLKEGVRFQADAIEALHEAAEQYLVERLKEGNDLAVWTGGVTLMLRHLQMARALRGE